MIRIERMLISLPGHDPYWRLTAVDLGTGLVVGFVDLGMVTADEASVKELFVDERRRHDGIGARLMAEAEALAGEAYGAKTLALTIDAPEDSKGLIQWYQRRGFDQIEDREGLFVMSKELG